MKVTYVATLCCSLFLAEEAFAQIPLNPNPSRAVGHLQRILVTTSPNLVEGRELYAPQGVAVDTANGIAWVADTGNNRVLGWKGPGAFENGAFADFVVGQRDMLTTVPQGPGVSNFNSGLNAPTGVAVDSQGNLYVADAGNNRIIRYPRPFDQPDTVKLADLVIGQPNFTSRNPNAGGVTERSLALNTGSVFQVSPLFDAQGNLWINDAGNNRLLRYPSSALGDGASNGPAATIVLGQSDFRTNDGLGRNPDPRVKINKSKMQWPGPMALDQSGRLFVPDQNNRVLVYRGPFVSGMDATRVMGITPAVAQGQQALPAINEYTMGIAISGGDIIPPSSVFTIGNIPFVVDTPAHRIMRFPAFDTWAAETQTDPSPKATAIIGQDTSQQSELKPNRGLAEPNSSSLLAPSFGVFAGGETWIVDSQNNRVLVMGDISTGPPLAATAPYNAKRVLGQIGLEFRSPNFIEGREFNFGGGAGIVIDNSATPPRMYVADTNNHRILGFSNALKVRQGDKADIVIGQPDFYRSVINFPFGEFTTRGNQGLASPLGVAVDKEGNLFVCDSGNGRVLRFPKPFEQRQRPMQADMVIGQSSFTSRFTDATARTMAVPYGLVFSSNGSLFVSDAGHNRILQFTPPFSTGMAATRVFGQPDFNSSDAGNADNRYNGVRHIAMDSDDRLHAADEGNSRIAIYGRLISLSGNDPRPATLLRNGVNRPISLFVSLVTGEIWVGNTGALEARRYPKFDDLTIKGDAPDYRVNAASPRALTLDAFSNLYVADGANRIAIHYPTIVATNGAHFLPRVTPGMITTLKSTPFNYTFTDQIVVASQVPLPKELGGIQVLINDQPVPIYFISAEQINFLMPNNAPSSGTVDLEVTQPATGRVITAAQIPMDVASPALFTLLGTGTGQVVAANAEDNNTLNGSGLIGTTTLVAAERGKVITLYGTGAGHVDGAPADGTAPTGIVAIPELSGDRAIVIGAAFVPGDHILYSGLAPGLPGVWQINVKVPLNTAPGPRVPIALRLRDIGSTLPPTVVTTIAVR
ncbi:MAG: hypothetical protein U0Q16_34965 [Bryobacteraceae bacterium]